MCNQEHSKVEKPVISIENANTTYIKEDVSEKHLNQFLFCLTAAGLKYVGNVTYKKKDNAYYCFTSNGAYKIEYVLVEN